MRQQTPWPVVERAVGRLDPPEGSAACPSQTHRSASPSHPACLCPGPSVHPSSCGGTAGLAFHGGTLQVQVILASVRLSGPPSSCLALAVANSPSFHERRNPSRSSSRRRVAARSLIIMVIAQLATLLTAILAETVAPLRMERRFRRAGVSSRLLSRG